MTRLTLALLFIVITSQSYGAKIITLSPHSAELVYFADGADQLIGVAAWTQFPDSTKKLPVISNHLGINREMILALEPEIAIYWESGIKSMDLAWLKNQGIKTLASDPLTPEQILEDIIRVSNLLGTDAKEQLQIMEQQLKTIREIGRQRTKPIQIIQQIWFKPLILLTDQHLISRTLKLCGIDTPIHHSHKRTLKVSHEFLVFIQPDAIAIGQEQQKNIINPNGVRVISINSDKLHKASPRLLEEALRICQIPFS